MTKPKVTLAGLKSQIEEGLQKLGSDIRGPDSNAIWEMFDRYLKEPGNHFDRLFENAGLDRNDVRHLQAVIWTVTAPLYIKDAEWNHRRCVELLKRAVTAKLALEIAEQPREIRDVCLVLVNPRHLGNINRGAINRVVKAADANNEFWIGDYKDMKPASLETRLHETLSDYELFMRGEERSRCTPLEIKIVETALDSFRPEWRKT